MALGQASAIWESISTVWIKLDQQSRASSTPASSRDDTDSDEELITVALSLARFVRNLVAGSLYNQENALLAHIPPSFEGFCPSDVID